MVLSELEKCFNKAIKSLKELKDTEAALEFSVPRERVHGDFATNIAFLLAKKNGLNPVELAKTILSKAKANDTNHYLERAEVAGAGFINLFLSKKAWKGTLIALISAGDNYARSVEGKGRTIVVDYGSENIAKPMSVGHLRSNIIGQATCNIYRYLGWRVIGDNFIGDWGTQFGKLIVAYKHWGNKEAVETDPINELVTLYQRFHKEAEADADLEDEAREEFKKLESGDADNRHLWEWFVGECLTAFDSTHLRLGVIFDVVRGESFYEEKSAEIVKTLLKRKIATKNKDCSVIIEFDKEELPPMIIMKSDGATLYATRDLAAIRTRLDEFKPERIVYFVDHAQELHFRQLFATAKRLGWECNYTHASFGRINFKGERISTRAGHLIYLNSLLDRTVIEARGLLDEKGLNLSEQEKDGVAEMIGVGAVIYNDLSQNRVTNIDFSWEKALDFDGNTAPYLQYTYARARSILARAEEEKIDLLAIRPSVKDGLKEEELLIIQHVLTYGDVLRQAAYEYKPNLVANFSYELAQRFNHFYNTLPVLKARGQVKMLRLGIVLIAANLLKSSLELLGIKVPPKM